MMFLKLKKNVFRDFLINALRSFLNELVHLKHCIVLEQFKNIQLIRISGLNALICFVVIFIYNT